MWTEGDFPPQGPPQLESVTEPGENGTYMYHGTTKAAAAAIQREGFRQSKDGMLGKGVYLSRDLQKASRYPLDHPEYDRAVVKVRVNVGRVIAINYQGHPQQKTWHDYGFDTAWVPPNCGMVQSGLEEDCVWDPKRIQVINIIYPMLGQQGSIPQDPLDDKGVYTMYHGTSKEAAKGILMSGFRQSSGGMLGRGVYLSRDLQKASRYPLELPESQRVIIKVIVRVGRVKKIDCQGHPLQKTCTKDNRADEASRGLRVRPFIDHNRWIQAPSLLRLPEQDWPCDVVDTLIKLDDPEVKKEAVVNEVNVNASSDSTSYLISYISDWRKLKVKLAWLLRLRKLLLYRARRRKVPDAASSTQDSTEPKGSLTVEKLDCLRLRPLIRFCQRQRFEEEIAILSARKTVSKKNVLYKLDPRLEDGMWAEDDFVPFDSPRLQSVDRPDDDKTYTVYHGTSREAAASILRTWFKQSSGGMLGRGVYLSRDLKKASKYPLNLFWCQKVILKVSVSVGKVKKINYKYHPMQYSWHTKYGYDTAWVPPNCGVVKSGLEEDCVWDPDRIKIVDVIYPSNCAIFCMVATAAIFLIGAAVILLFPEEIKSAWI
ncbi:uncharacterized protein LOC134453804 [Engraulis encrasicolus]|uniref:uncharacterized protein LOC134453804 n=1 Tax=Engraulis encrasicolus TaxID=184585 RepID=UPI002FD4BB97